jgi:DNA-directed RNA polymerase specialized sigma24 family protein
MIDIFLYSMEWDWDHETFGTFAYLCRKRLKGLLEKFVAGEPLDVGEMKGTFTTDLDKGLLIMEYAWKTYCDDMLYQSVRQAVKEVTLKLNSPEFRTVVDIMEKNHGWVKTSPENLFPEVLQHIKGRLKFNIDLHNLRIPGWLRLDNDDNFEQSEEYNIAAGAVWETLLEKGRGDPIKVLLEAWEGKLTNILVKAAMNNLRDRFRHDHAKKRDAGQVLSLDEPIDNDWDHEPELLRETIPSGEQDILDYMTDLERRDEILSLLDDDERDVILGWLQGETGEEIAERKGRSTSWVSKKKRSAFEKIRAYFKKKSLHKVLTWCLQRCLGPRNGGEN